MALPGMALAVENEASRFAGRELSGRLSAGETRLWALGIVAVAYWADIVRGAVAVDGAGVAAAINRVLDNGAFDVFAWGLLFLRCATAERERPAASRAILAAATLGVIVLVPARLASGLALLLAGLLLFSGPDVPAPVRPARLLLFALALETVWLSPLVAPLHMVLARLDAQVVPLLLGAVGQAAEGHGNVVENVSARFSIEIWPYCASSYPLAGMVLAFTAIVMYRGATLRRAHLPWLALSCLASMALTELRLVLLAGGKASYHWWHDGNGSVLYGLAALGLSVAFPIVATRVAPVPARGRLAGSAA
jgi:hypothetical protein